jgi:hypothetical protein
MEAAFEPQVAPSPINKVSPEKIAVSLPSLSINK